jgi:hypothetical protein
MRILVSIFLSIVLLSGSAQNTMYKLSPDIKIQTFEKIIKVDSNDYTLISFEVNNTTSDSLLLWYSEKDINKLSKDEIIKQHFYISKGDFNLFQLATETITETTRLPENNFSFYTALIKPNSTFTYNIILKGQISESVQNSFKRLLNNQLVIISQLELSSYFNISTLDRITDKTGKMIIDWNVIKNEILEQ